jgi:hypothetical protein
MGFWDQGTHMSKENWRAACKRTLNRLENLKIEPAAPTSKQAARQKPKAR